MCTYPLPAFFNGIKMESGIKKCASIIVKRGKIANMKNINLATNNITFPALSANETYKYLVKQEKTYNTKEMIENLENNYKN